MVFNVIDSPDIVSSSKQPKYVTLEYCFISIPLYIILSFPTFSNLSFEPKSMHFVLSSSKLDVNIWNSSCVWLRDLHRWIKRQISLAMLTSKVMHHLGLKYLVLLKEALLCRKCMHLLFYNWKGDQCNTYYRMYF